MNRLLTIILAFFITANLFGQPLYPVRTITTVSPPYPTSLEQYANVEDGYISLTLIPNDVALQNYPVRLRLVINGGYYKIYTNPSFVHKSIVLNNGENLSLSGPELAEWFNPDNLIFEGYTRNQYQKTGRLPEGMYQIWFEVYDFYRDINISGSIKELKATVWTFENDPPMLNFPANEKEVPAADPQNIVLNWTQRQAPFSSAGAANQYKLEVWEIVPDDMNVDEAVRTTRPIYSGEVQTTTFNYSADQPILFPGKKYAWRVQVYDPAGKNRYKNDGYSEVRWFRFGKDCTAPTPLLDKVYFTAAGLKWENDIRFSKYELRWKNKDIANSNWYTKDATGQGSTIDKLEQNTNYYVQMRGFCGAQEGEFSQSLTIHTKQDANFACGGAPGVLDSADNIPLAALNKGEIFKAYDFDIETYQVSGGNGSFSGKGFALVPLLKSIKFEVEFSGITINNKRRMTNGEVKFIYNEKNGLVVSVNSLVNAIIGDKTENNPYEDIANKKTSVNAPITSINVSASGDVTIVTEDGHKETVRASASNGDMVYIGGTSDNAEQTVVDSKTKTVYTATPEKSNSGSGANGLGTAALKQPTSNNEPIKYAVTFLPHTLTTLGGMDYPSATAPKGNYNNATIGGTEVLVPWKSVESNKIDRLVAAVDGPADSIHFITKNENMVMTAPGDKSAVSEEGLNHLNPSSNQTFKQLLVTGVDNTDELKAWYPEYEKVNDTTNRQNRILAGQVNIAAFDKICLDVCIVEVNGAAVPEALPIEKVLNDIYAPALVQLKITRIRDFNPTLTTLKAGKFDSDHPGSMKYNDCENEVIEAFKNRKDYSSKTLYLFFIGGEKTPTTNRDTKGYMEFNRNFGFIFRDNQDLNELIRTMGHELGHGAFRLKHTFSDECPFKQDPGQTFNLMDYVDKSKAASAVLLHNYQWKEVHDWDLGANWFEGGEEGEEVGFFLSDLPNDYKNKNGSLSFFAASGEIITLPSNTTYVKLGTVDPLYYTKSGKIAEFTCPVGGLLSFSVKDKTTNSLKTYSLLTINGILSYQNEDKKNYQDILSSSSESLISFALVGLPYYEGGNLGFELYKVPVSQDQKPKVKTETFGKIDLDPFTIVDKKFGQPSNVIQEIANSPTYGYLILIDLSKPITNKPTLTYKFFDELSPVGKAYLEANKSYCSKGNSLAPIIISNAFWMSLVPSTEIASTCQMSESNAITEFNTFKQHLEQDIIEQVGLITEEGSKMWKSREATKLYYSFRSNIRDLNFTLNITQNINSKLEDANLKSGEQVFSLLKLLQPCELEYIKIENRIKAIDLLASWNDKDGEEKAEEMIVKLVNSTIYNSQAKQLTDKIFENKGTLFYRLYESLDGSDLDAFESKLSEILRIDNENDEFKHYISMSTDNPEAGLLGHDFGFGWDFKKSEGKVLIKKLYGISDMEQYNYVSGFPLEIALSDFVKVKFPKEKSFLNLYENKDNNDEEMIMPAFYLARLMENRIKEQNFKCIRVIGNLIAILTAIPSEGQSFTVWGAISVGLAGGDIIMTYAEDELKRDGAYGEAIVDAWSLVQWADLGVGATNISRELLKGANKTFKITLRANQLIDQIATTKLDAKILNALRTTVWNLRLLKLDHFSSILYSKLLSRIESIEITKVFKAVKSNSKLTFKNWVECSVDINGKPKKLFDIGNSSKGAYINNTFENALGEGDEIIGEFTSIKYMDEASQSIKEAPVKVAYNSASDRVYLIKTIVTQTENITDDFLTGLKKYFSAENAKKVYDYFKNPQFANLKVKQWGGELVDARDELLKFISNFRNKSDLIADLSIIDSWVFLKNFPNLRNDLELLANVKVILSQNKKLYSSLDEVQNAINSSNNVGELVEKLSLAKTADEFSTALKDVKTIDFSVNESVLKAPSLKAPNLVNTSEYNKIIEELEDLAKRRALATDITEKATLSEQIGLLATDKYMLERGYLKLEHQISETAKQGQFDRIYWNGDETKPQVFVIESKGGSGCLGSRELTSGENITRRAQQGTSWYRDDIINNMSKKIPDLADVTLKKELRKTIDLINEAIDNKGLNYLLIRQNIKSDGTLGELIIKQF